MIKKKLSKLNVCLLAGALASYTLIARADAYDDFYNYTYPMIYGTCYEVVACNQQLWTAAYNEAAGNYNWHVTEAYNEGCSFTSGNPGNPTCQDLLFNIEYWEHTVGLCDQYSQIWFSC